MPLELYQRGRIFWTRGYPADGDQYVRKSLGTSDEAIAQAAIREIESAARKRRILGPDAPKPEDELTFAACVMLTDFPASDRRYLKPIVRKIGRIRVKEITPAFVRKLAKELYPFAAVDTWQRQVVTPIRSTINHAHELGKCPPIRIRRFDEDERIRQDRARGKESRVPKRPGSWEWLEAFKLHATPRDAALAHFMFRHGARVSQSILMRPYGLEARPSLFCAAAPGTKRHFAADPVHLRYSQFALRSRLTAPRGFMENGEDG